MNIRDATERFTIRKQKWIQNALERYSKLGQIGFDHTQMDEATYNATKLRHIVFELHIVLKLRYT